MIMKLNFTEDLDLWNKQAALVAEFLVERATK